MLISIKSNAQRQWIKQYGIDYSLPKYSISAYNSNYVNINDNNSIYTKNTTTSFINLLDDVNYFLRLKKDNNSLKFSIGMFSERTKLNTEQPFILFQYNDWFSVRNGIRLHASYSRRVYAKRSAHVYISGGIYTNVFTYKPDLNPINISINLLSEVKKSVVALNDTYKENNIYLDHQYAVPKIGLVYSINTEFRGNIISLVGEYQNSNFILFNKKDLLYKNLNSIKLEWAIILGYK